MNKFQEPLEKLFDKHRIIFWCDEEVELLEEFNSVDILGVEKIVVSNNEFSVKYKISREFSDKKFLLYFEGKEPDYLDDWLLDIKLANYTFHTTPEAIVLQELGLDYRFRDFIKAHKEFFKSKSRTEKFKKLLITDVVTEDELRMTILKAVITSEAISIEDLILKLLSITTDKQEKIFKDLNKFNISNYFWLVIKKSIIINQILHHYMNSLLSYLKLLQVLLMETLLFP
ncbi:hypothetical protein EW093_04995 [Thiospirochaeta perfilievii]|uniref:BREX-1 system phosphatase PglZ type A n=1 Tax=Thiospirochaeta perfilievii TaxID=252967 RepID=A0A5C1QD00_9SPIO|nr:hypothetical protein [Thiospirochaeta perfilievii]QEN04082.1 hypothetical protein EW093_04995 [Thiospirochaeta perfilievii]